MASTNGLQNNALVVNTIDGLTTLYATSIYDNGQVVDPGSFVPYTGAIFNVDLNNNQLNDVNSLQVNSSIAAASLTTTGLITTNSLQVNSSIAAASLTTTGLITTNTLKINSVPSGTQTSLLAVDSSGNVIQGASSPPTQIQINAGLTTGIPYYLTFVPSNTGLAKNQSLYTEAYYNGYEIQYFPNTQKLQVYNIDIEGQVTIPNLGSSASPSYYLCLNTSNQMVKVSGVSAQPSITQVSASGTYYPVFVNSNSAQSGATIYVDPNTSPLSYTMTGQTLLCKNLTVSGTTTISGYATLASPAFTGTPTAPTAASGTNTTQIATTAFITTALQNYIPLQGSIAGLNLNAYLGGSTSKFNIYSSTSTLLLGIQQATSPYVSADSLAVTNSFTVGGASVITSTGTTTGVNNIIKLAGTSAQFIIQSSTGGALLSVRQSATPYVGIDSLNVTNALAVGTTSTFTGAITASSDLTVIGTHYGVSYAGSLIANMVFNSPGGGKNIIFQYAGTPILTLNASGGSAVFYNGLVYADAGAGALILGVNGSAASNLALSATNATLNSQYLLLNNTSNPYLCLGSGLNYVAYATSASSFINDSAVGDLCINSRAGNIRLAGNTYGATGLLLTNSYVYPKLPIQMSSSQGIFFSDLNKGIQYNGTNTGGSYWANSLPTDGVSVFGWADGVLGTKTNGTQAISLYWNTSGVTVYGNLTFSGVPSITATTAGFNWYVSSTQLGYFDTGNAGWRISANQNMTIQCGSGYSILFYPQNHFAASVTYGSGVGYFNSNYVNVVSDNTTGSNTINGTGVAISNGQNKGTWAFWTYGYGSANTNTSCYVICNATGNGVQMAAGATSWGAYSDRRCKKDICIIGDGHKNLMKLKPIHFKYLTDEKLFPEKTHRHGFVAQEFAEVYPQHVSANNPPMKVNDDEEIENPMSIHMVEIIPDLVDSIQYLTLKAQRHKDRIVSLEEAVKTQQETIRFMAQHITTLTDTLNALLAKYPI
jgi:hypothetical protein